uniref:ATP synthase F0 subunit 8 n=1 Tax=Alpheus brevicristatus TaxID=622418 RepID=UPI002551F1CD|nr:ATP synthase F0 subunit 8 [Alpheus brevicristatus]WGU20728.1 ATP synthase F0 subunit 8 [Alpheus brevicristatus]
MPQMSPLLWLNLYFMFTVTLVIFIAMFFFSKTPSLAPSIEKTTPQSKLNWKW